MRRLRLLNRREASLIAVTWSAKVSVRKPSRSIPNCSTSAMISPFKQNATFRCAPVSRFHGLADALSELLLFRQGRPEAGGPAGRTAPSPSASGVDTAFVAANDNPDVALLGSLWVTLLSTDSFSAGRL